MSPQSPVATATLVNYGWIPLILVALLQTLASLFLLLFSGPDVFESDTGVAWAELVSAFPSAATQFEIAQQASLVGNLFIGLFAAAVTFFAYRTGQRWAWYAMWLLPASMAPGTISLALSETQAGSAIFGGSFIVIAVAGLLVSYRAFYPKV